VPQAGHSQNQDPWSWVATTGRSRHARPIDSSARYLAGESF